MSVWQWVTPTWRVGVDDGYHGVTQGTRTSSHFVSLSTQASCLFCFCFFLFCLCFPQSKNVQRWTVTSPRQRFRKTTWKLLGVELRENVSVSQSRVRRKRRGGKKKCFLKIKNRGLSGEAGTHFFFEGREFFHLSVFLRRWRDTGLTSQHFEIKRHFIVLCLRRWQSDCVFEVWKMCLQTNKQTLLLSGSWKNPYSSLTSSLLF